MQRAMATHGAGAFLGGSRQPAAGKRTACKARIIICSGGEAGGRGGRQRNPSPPRAQRLEGVPELLRPSQTPEGQSPAAQQPLSTQSLLLVAAALGGSVAADVSGANGGLHLLQHLDTSVHVWVNSNSAVWSLEVQKLVAGKLISDAAIAGGLLGWAAAAGVALQTRSPRLLQALAVSGAAYWAGGGRIWGSDPLLVDALKKAFQRARPSEHYNTYAFPSGHTTAAAFICGVLLFVLLPLALEAWQEQQQEQQQAAGSSSGSGTSGGAMPQPVAWLLANRWQVWGAGVGLTAFGRMMADVHWCSDTMAGACLGAALTACVAQLSGIQSLGSTGSAADAAAAEKGGGQ